MRPRSHAETQPKHTHSVVPTHVAHTTRYPCGPHVVRSSHIDPTRAPVDNTQPNEPFLFPKLRNHIADFPCVLFATKLEIFSLGRLMRKFVRRRGMITRSIRFSRPMRGAPDGTKSVPLCKGSVAVSQIDSNSTATVAHTHAEAHAHAQNPF